MPEETVVKTNRSKEIPFETTTMESTRIGETIPESEQEESRMMVTLRSFKLTPVTTVSPFTSHQENTTPFEEEEKEEETTEQSEETETTPIFSSVIDEVNEHQVKSESPIPPYSKDDNDYVPDTPIHLDPQDEALEELEAEIDIENQQKKIIDLRRKEQLMKEMEKMNSSTEYPYDHEEGSSTPPDHTFPSENLMIDDKELKKAEQQMKEDRAPPSLRVSLTSQIPEGEIDEESTTTKKISSDGEKRAIDSMEDSLARMDSAELRLV
ncbi:hypothetical protein PRIPAC_92513 [Pristionchus pacificus]|nr:hypothetical protein PRIPAC_92513 [Pristionchus pacificus]